MSRAYIAIAAAAIFVAVLLLSQDRGEIPEPAGPDPQRPKAESGEGEPAVLEVPNLTEPRAAQGQPSRDEVDPEAGVEADAPGPICFEVQLVNAAGAPVRSLAVALFLARAQDDSAVTRLAGEVRPKASLISDSSGLVDWTVPTDVLRALGEPLTVQGARAQIWVKLPPDSPFVRPEMAIAVPGERLTLVLGEAGRLEVHLGEAAAGASPWVMPKGWWLRGEDGRSKPRAHLKDVTFELTRSGGGHWIRGDAIGPHSMGWGGLSEGMYRLEAKAMGRKVQMPGGVLEDLWVPAGGRSLDARLVGWNPFAGTPLMLVTVRGPGGGVPPELSIEISQGGGTVGHSARYDGRVLLVPVPEKDDQGRLATLHAQAPGTRRASLPVQEGDVTIQLRRSLMLELVLSTPEGLPGPTDLWISGESFSEEDGDWSTIERIVDGAGTLRLELPFPGRFSVRGQPVERFSQSTEHPSRIVPFEFDVAEPVQGAVNVRVEIAMEPSKQ